MQMQDANGPWRGIRGQLVAIKAAGLELDEVASAIGLTVEEVISSDESAPQVAGELWRTVADMSGDPAIALHTAKIVPFGAFDHLDYVASNTPTIGDCLDAIAQYFCTLRSCKEVAVAHDRFASVVQLRCPSSFDTALYRYGTEFTFACIVDRLRTICTKSWNPELMRWKHAAPSYVSAYEEFFRCPMQFGAQTSELVVSAETRDWVIPNADARLRALMERSTRQLYGHSLPKMSWAHRVRSLLTSGLLTRDVKLATVAEQLHVSPRTLRRYLQGEGTSFQQELDVVRSEIATRLMLQGHVTVADASRALGFTDISAFTRAFRRWTGATPAAWRRAQQQ